MGVELNHTIVWSRDKAESAAFLGEILGLPVGEQWGPFVPLVVGNGVTLDFADSRDVEIAPQHYAFLVSDEEFDAALARVRAAGTTIWADPFKQKPGEINHDYGGRGFYFPDPSGHDMEVMTTPYGAQPERVPVSDS